MLRLVALVVVLLLLVALPFAIWGGDLESWLTIDGAAEWMHGFGAWAWAAGMGLIALDIFLPIPATAIMAALGIIYGPLLGGLIASAGSILAGVIGYALCRLIGPVTADRLAGAPAMAEARALFERWGGWLVAASRWLPVLPETVAFLAGLARMHFGRFLAALVCGAVPLGFAYAGLGHLGADAAGSTLVVAALMPLALWFIARRFMRGRISYDR